MSRAVPTPQTIGIVGASLAGLRAAQALRREGFDGELVVVGAESRLPYDRPPLSKQVLAGTWDPVEASLPGATELDAQWLLGQRATALDARTRTLTLADGDELHCDGIVIATGSVPRTLPGTAKLAGVYTLRTLDDCLALREELDHGPRVAVIGAGFIGAEVASTCAARGLDVCVVEALDVPLARAVGPQMGDYCGRLHAANGVELRLGVGVTGFDAGDDGRVARVVLSDDTSVDADVVVLGVGVVPEVSWLAGSGLALDDGVVCNAWCEASPGIVAAGDVARWDNPLFGVSMRVEHWSNAADSANVAARTLLRGAGESEPFSTVPYFWSDQYGVKIQFLGHLRGGEEVAVVEGSLESARFVAAYGRDDRVVGALLFNQPGRLPAYKSLIAEGAPFPPSPPPRRASPAAASSP